MKICTDHWSKLRAAIDVRGLTQYIAKDGRIAAQNLVLELEGREAEAYYDPLMAAHNMIFAGALERIGLSLMVGDKCPVCEGVKYNLEDQEINGVDPRYGRLLTTEDEEKYWIDGPADAVLEICLSKGMKPSKSSESSDDPRSTS